MDNLTINFFELTAQGWRPALEILILWFVIYHILLFLEGTRAIQVLRGVIVLLVSFFLFQKFGFMTLDWLLTKLFGISVIAILIIFQPELRQGLARLGQRNLFGTVMKEEEIEDMLQQIFRACEALCREKLGALIVIENKNSLNEYIENGVAVDGRVSAELIQAVFTPKNPLHDGGMVIQHGRIAAAACLFPLTQNQSLSRIFGTRHRAALGLSEETDAVVIVVSEERQDMSLVHGSKLYKDLNREELIVRIQEILKAKNG
jgi:diadenylate cyclase